jgi:hypothetical protein
MTNKALYQEATRVRRKAKWIADDYLCLTGDLAGYRRIMRLRRRFIWYCGFWRKISMRVIGAILKRIYTPAITALFASQTMVYNMFNKEKIDGKAGIRVSVSQRSDADRGMDTHQQAVEEVRRA